MNSLREVSLDKHSFPTKPDHPPRSSKFSIPPENSSIKATFTYLRFLASCLSNQEYLMHSTPLLQKVAHRFLLSHWFECQLLSSKVTNLEEPSVFDSEIESERRDSISRRRYREIASQSHLSQQLNTSTPSPTIAPVKSADTSLKASVSSIKNIEETDDSTDSENYYDCESDDSLSEVPHVHQSTLQRYVTKSNSSNSSHDLALSFHMTLTQNLTKLLHSLGPCVTEIERLRTEFMIAERANNSLRMREVGLLLSRRIKAEAEADGRIQELTPFNIMMIANAFRAEYRQFITKDGVRYKCPNFNPLRMFAEKHCAEWGYSSCGGDPIKRFVSTSCSEVPSSHVISLKRLKNSLFSSPIPEVDSLRELLQLNNLNIREIPQEKIGHVYASIFLHKPQTEDDSFFSSFIETKPRKQKLQVLPNLDVILKALDTEAHALGFIYATHVTHPAVLKSLGWAERDIRRNEVFVFCFERIPNQESTV